MSYELYVDRLNTATQNSKLRCAQRGDLRPPLGVEPGQRQQRSGRRGVRGVLLLDDRVDVPAQVAADQLVDQRDDSLRRRRADQRPVRADLLVQAQLRLQRA